MMKKRTFLFALLLFVFSFAAFSQSEVTVTKNDGTVSVLNVNSLGKIYFSTQFMFVDNGNGEVSQFTVSDIRKLQFAASTVGVEDAGDNASFLLYPNPATTFFRVAGDESQQMKIQIYSVTGQLLLSTYAETNENVDVSTLPSGMYFVNVNGKTIKMCKK